MPCDATGTLPTTKIPLPSAKSTVFWTDFDAVWQGEVGLLYRIEAYRDGQKVYEGSCGPLDVNTTIMSSESHIGSDHSVAHQGLLQCPTLEGGGEVEVRAQLITEGSIALKKCDLVLKQ